MVLRFTIIFWVLKQVHCAHWVTVWSLPQSIRNTAIIGITLHVLADNISLHYTSTLQQRQRINTEPAYGRVTWKVRLHNEDA